MKIYKFFIIGLAFASLGFAACESVDANDKKKPIERYRETKDLLSNTLLSSEHGWVVNFFPSKDSYGGYYLWMDFLDDSKVKVRSDFSAADLSVSEDEYNLIMLNTLTLNFPVKGKIHHFTEANQYLHRTDIEFLFSRIDGEDIIFKGHMTNHEIRFRKATKELKDNYMGHIAVRSALDSFNRMIITGDGTPKVIGISKQSGGDGRMYKLSERGYLKEELKQDLGISCGSDIIITSEPIIVEGVELSEFKLIDGRYVAENNGKKAVLL